jgi:hypothetical protein
MSSILLLSMMKRTRAFSIAQVQRQTRALQLLPAAGTGHNNAQEDPSSSLCRQPRWMKTTSSKNGSTRLYSFNRFDDDNNKSNDEGKNKVGFLSKVMNKAKQYLPFLRTEQEQKAAIEKKRVKSELQSSIQQVLRDAPLPVRAMGNLVGSLLGSAVSELAAVASQQNDLIDRCYGQAVAALAADDAVRAALGSPVQAGPITSQSSSTTSINGRSTTRVQLGFAVYGSRGGGQAQLSMQTTSNDTDPVPTLQVRLNTGQILSVPMDGRRSNSSSASARFSSSPWSNKDDDTVIEAEIIDKKPSR